MRQRLLSERVEDADLAILRTDQDEQQRVSRGRHEVNLPPTLAQPRRDRSLEVVDIVSHRRHGTVHVRTMDETTPTPKPQPELFAPQAILDAIVEQVVSDLIPGDGHAIDKLNAALGNGQAIAAMITLGALTGYAAGYSSKTPAQPREVLLAASLRAIHTDDGFGDCREDGDPFPCQTIRAVDITMGTPEPVIAEDDFGGEGK